MVRRQLFLYYTRTMHKMLNQLLFGAYKKHIRRIFFHFVFVVGDPSLTMKYLPINSFRADVNDMTS